jgi:hypothetical protein
MKKITLITAAILVAFSMNAQIFSDDFEADVVDTNTFSNWTAIDDDGDGENWEVADLAAYASANAPNHPINTNAADSDSWEGVPFSPDNFLVTQEPIDLTNATGTTIEALIGSYQINGSFIADKFAIYMSTSNNPADIIQENPIFEGTAADFCTCDQEDGSASASVGNFDASAYDGQVVYLTFRHFDTVDENSVLIDNVVVNATLSVEDNTFENFSYFVDANNVLNLKAGTPMQSVELFSVIGQQVVSQKLNNTSEVLNISNLESGVYITKVSINGVSKSFKIIKR